MLPILRKFAWGLARAAALSSLVAAAVGASASAAAPGGGSSSVTAPASAGDAVASRHARVIVAFKPQAQALRLHPLTASSAPAVRTLAQQRAAELAGHAGMPLRGGRMIDATTQVVTAEGVDSATLVRRLASHPDVARAVVDRRKRALYVPNDPLFATGDPVHGPEVGQWHLRAPTALFRSAIDAVGAWDRAPRGSNAGAGVVVAVVDSGIRPEHPDLVGRLLPGYDMIADTNVDGLWTANDGDGRDADPSDPGDWITVEEDADPAGPGYLCGAGDSSWHGTMVAGVVGARAGDGIGMAGVAGTLPAARVLPVRVLGRCGGWDSDVLAGMRWAAGLTVPGVPVNPHPARVVNVSLGGGELVCSFEYRLVVQELLERQAVIVAAAGNSVGLAVGEPANCPGVIAVGGLRHAGTKVGFSDLGPEITISAPAGNCVNIGVGEPCLYPILTTTHTGTRGPVAGGSAWTDSYNYSVGTSFSAPLVSGTIALMLSVDPTLTPVAITSVLRSTARPFPVDGADNGVDGEPVQVCRAPDGVEQLQCYCRVGLCGAGMLDAAAAVRAVVPGTTPTPVPAGAGGGAVGSAGWLLALLGAVGALARGRRSVGRSPS